MMESEELIELTCDFFLVISIQLTPLSVWDIVGYVRCNLNRHLSEVNYQPLVARIFEQQTATFYGCLVGGHSLNRWFIEVINVNFD
jgi:hypothetical protein